MSLFSDTFIRLFRGKKKHGIKKQPKRVLQMEPLEERQLLAVVSLEGTKLSAYEAPTSTSANWGVVTVRRDAADITALNVIYEVTGTATYGSDYESLGLWFAYYDNGTGQAVYRGTTTIPANQATTTITIKPINDAKKENTESVIIRLAGSSGCGCGCGCGSGGSYSINPSAATATVTIQDNDDWTVGVVATDNIATEGTSADYGLYTITRTGETDLTHPLTVSFKMEGTATYNYYASYSDYQLYNSSGNQIYLSQSYDYTTYQYVYIGSVTIPSGQTSTTIELRPVNDSIRESNETAILKLTQTGYGCGCGYGCGYGS